jgi:uncharacterized protein
MRGPEGGFYSALDADSPVPGNRQQNGEGAYYVWSTAQVKELLGSDAPAFQYRYGVRPNGNIPLQQDIEGTMRGLNVLYLQHSLAATASYFNSSEVAKGATA